MLVTGMGVHPQTPKFENFGLAGIKILLLCAWLVVPEQYLEAGAKNKAGFFA